MHDRTEWRGSDIRGAEGERRGPLRRFDGPDSHRIGRADATRYRTAAQRVASGGDEAPAVAKRWYVVHTHPNRESTAARNLAYQGFSVFLPQRFKTRRHARRVETVFAAYFPCYLFVGFDPARDRWLVINSTFGVRHLLMSGGVPEPVPPGLVEQMIARTDGAGILCLHEEIDDGQPVMVTGGPFADLVGTLEQLSPSDRVRVLLDILGGVRVTLPRNGVAPVER